MYSKFDSRVSLVEPSPPHPQHLLLGQQGGRAKSSAYYISDALSESRPFAPLRLYAESNAPRVWQ